MMEERDVHHALVVVVVVVNPDLAPRARVRSRARTGAGADHLGERTGQLDVLAVVHAARPGGAQLVRRSLGR